MKLALAKCVWGKRSQVFHVTWYNGNCLHHIKDLTPNKTSRNQTLASRAVHIEHTVQMHDNTDTGKTEWMNLNGSELKHVFHVRIWIIWLTTDKHDYIITIWNMIIITMTQQTFQIIPLLFKPMLMLKSQWNGCSDTFLPYCDIL